MNSNLLIVLTGKTASGKDTVMARLLSRLTDFKKIITTTSRIPRNNEKEGMDYYFISETDFRRKIKAGDFIEYVEYGGNLYGTEKSRILNNLNSNLIWRIDPSRAGQIKEFIKNTFRVLVIYLTANDTVILERLKKRGLSRQEIERRMREDAKFWQEFKANYDYVIENVPGKLDETIDKIVNRAAF